jgi:hypothetical protein
MVGMRLFDERVALVGAGVKGSSADEMAPAAGRMGTDVWIRC